MVGPNLYSIAKDSSLPFGKYSGKTLDQITYNERGPILEGLRYLDWLLGQDWFTEKFKHLANMVTIFLQEPAVEVDLNEALGHT
jgi:uncharacterized protein (DUF3820 family)